MPTTLELAFREAGYKPPFIRAFDLAVQAWARHPAPGLAAERRRFLTDHLCGDMTWAVLEQFSPASLPQMAGRLLNKAANEIRRQRPEDVQPPVRPEDVQRPVRPMRPEDVQPSVRPMRPKDVQPPVQPEELPMRPMRPMRPEDAQRPMRPEELPDHSQVEPQLTNVGQGRGCPVPPTINDKQQKACPVPPTINDLADRQQRASRRNVEVQLSLLDEIRLDGQSIGDMTPNEARTWARGQAKHVRFITLITANLPPDEPIRRYHTDEAEIVRLWELAKGQVNNAPLGDVL